MLGAVGTLRYPTPPTPNPETEEEKSSKPRLIEVRTGLIRDIVIIVIDARELRCRFGIVGLAVDYPFALECHRITSLAVT